MTTIVHSRRGTATRLVLAFAVFGVFWGSWGALLPDIKSGLGVTDAQLGQALLFIPIGSIAAMLAAGRMVDAFGSRAFAPSLFVFAVAAPLPALATSTPAFIGALVLLGLASGLLDVVINACVSAQEIEIRRPLMGAAHAGFSAGVLPGGIATGLARTVGSGPLGVLLVVGLVTAAVGLVGIGLRVTFPPTDRSVGLHFTKPLILLGVLCALAFLIEDGMLSWTAIHLEETLGASPFVGSLGPAMLAVSMVVGRALTQQLAARYTERSIVTTAGWVGALGVALVALAPDPWLGLCGVIVTGGAISACAPLIFGLAGRLGGPGRAGQAIARVTTFAYTGFFVGPPLVGGVAGAAGLRVGIGIMGVVSLALAVGARWLPQVDSRD